MCIRDSTKAYGAYTAKLALFAESVHHFDVHPSNFLPAPHVMSQVIHLKRLHPAKKLCREDELPLVCRVIDASFAQRRKTICNSLQSIGCTKMELQTALGNLGIDARTRAEDLEPAQFVELTRALISQGVFADD